MWVIAQLMKTELLFGSVTMLLKKIALTSSLLIIQGVSSMAWESTEIPHICGEMLVKFTSPKQFYKCRTCDVVVDVGGMDRFIKDGE